ncbi:Hypothetical predicted protein [Paramuricea clavata]|uniref:Uncharacterized protein n=1 Tax=Paramuricea clavata TaxID=317549 RepID=A0A7D9HZM2_PARCT|nr:Hypothetical predicted protein [Paramuricea clavata]
MKGVTVTIPVVYCSKGLVDSEASKILLNTKRIATENSGVLKFYLTRQFIQKTFFTWYLLLLVLAQVNSESNIIEGLCDWTVRSGERTIPASVHPVHFYACQSGQVTWEQPYGGVQMMFKTGVPQKTEGEYKVCISSRNNGFDIFTRNKDNFKLLRRYDAMNITSEICVSSQTKHVMIYVESAKDVNMDKAVFTYRAMFLGNGHGSLRLKDCKTCSRQELIKSFCTGDFAVHGNVKSVSTIGGSESRGEAVVVVKKVLHQSQWQYALDTTRLPFIESCTSLYNI